MRKGFLYVFSIMLVGVLMCGFSFSGKTSHNNAQQDDCYTTWSKPIYNNVEAQYYIAIDNGCPFAVQVTCRNGGVDYGQYCLPNEKGLKLTIGKTLENDYKVTAARAP